MSYRPICQLPRRGGNEVFFSSSFNREKKFPSDKKSSENDFVTFETRNKNLELIFDEIIYSWWQNFQLDAYSLVIFTEKPWSRGLSEDILVYTCREDSVR